MNIKITIFTPTYNRDYIIINLYKSLLIQTLKDFEWLIIDDGSTDNTELLVSSFIKDNKINIRYIKQQNGGKHRAINKALEEAKGELFFIVDSDDQLVDNAIERILYYFDQIKEDSSFAGVCGVKAYFDGKKVGGVVDFDILDCSSILFRYNYRMKGDMAEVFRTEIFRKYLFPDIEGECFCPEALVWNRIGMKYRLRYFNEKIYLCDYLQDGLTAKIVKLRMNSPLASMLYYSELYKIPIPFDQKLKAAINYWRFALCSKEKFADKVERIGLASLLLFPLGLLFHLKDLRS